MPPHKSIEHTIANAVKKNKMLITTIKSDADTITEDVVIGTPIFCFPETVCKKKKCCKKYKKKGKSNCRRCPKI